MSIAHEKRLFDLTVALPSVIILVLVLVLVLDLIGFFCANEDRVSGFV